MTTPSSTPASPASPTSPSSSPGRLDPALVRLALVLMIGSVAVGLDATIVNVAVDVLRRRFDASLGGVQWVSTGYLLALTMVVPLTAWSVERYGARRMWLVSLGTFGLCSVLCGSAWSIGSLIAFRVLQGLGGGMLLPLIRMILAERAGSERMGRAMVFVVVPGSLTPALGPVLGGLLVGVSWRLAFFVNTPLCVLGLVGAWILVPRDPPSASRSRLDVLGLTLLSTALGVVIFAFSRAGNRGAFDDTTVLACFGAGTVLFVGYTIHSFHTRLTPVLDLRLFRVRSFSASSTLLFLLGASLFGTLFLVPLYYQQARGASVLQAGLLVVPRGVGTVIAMTYVGRLIDRTRAERTIVLVGMALAVAGTVPGAFVGGHTSVVLLSLGFFVSGLGLGAVMLAAFTTTYRGLSPEQFGPATSGSRILQQLGGTLGIAVLAVVLQHELADRAPAGAFAHTFAWALALTGLAVVPALLLPPADR